MAKSKLTKDIEYWFEIFLNSRWEDSINECTIDRYGIVDILGRSQKIKRAKGKKPERENTWSCYEIKVSKQDFYSKSKWTFVGHYNYFIMPRELYDVVKKDIPDNVGVYIASYDNKNSMSFYSKKRAKRTKLKTSESTIVHEYIRSLYREHLKDLKKEYRKRKMV